MFYFYLGKIANKIHENEENNFIKGDLIEKTVFDDHIVAILKVIIHFLYICI